ncbi:MAG: hypothetical protein GC145_00480 [Caulobacter sp.]|nr:hypothetical protein [Caulobacter sp.]
MIRKVVVAASVGLLLSSQMAMAAESVRLGGVQGSVLVNQNGRYVPVTASTVLRPGDRVMAMDGSATVSYGANCNVAIAARSMATVAAASPCAGGSSNVIKTAYAGGGEDDQMGYGPTGDPGQGWDFWLWAGFGVVTVTAVAITVNDSNEPTSP